MVTNFVQGESAVLSIQQASIYVDACFILAFLDEDDTRSDKVANLINAWMEKEIEMGISSHTFTEVVGILMKNKIERALKIYIENMENIKSKGIGCLSEDDRRDIVSIEAACNLYEIYQYIIKVRAESEDESKEVYAKELLKVGKRHAKRRSGLTAYYTNVVQIFEEFLYSMENHFKIKVEYISSDKKAIDAAAQYMKLYQLEAYDAMHLAIARNKCDYFITLDQDFIQNFLKKDKNLQTKVIVFA